VKRVRLHDIPGSLGTFSICFCQAGFYASKAYSFTFCLVGKAAGGTVSTAFGHRSFVLYLPQLPKQNSGEDGAKIPQSGRGSKKPTGRRSPGVGVQQQKLSLRPRSITGNHRFTRVPGAAGRLSELASNHSKLHTPSSIVHAVRPFPTANPPWKRTTFSRSQKAGRPDLGVGSPGRCRQQLVPKMPEGESHRV